MSSATIVRAGELNELCTLELLTQTQSSSGGLVDTWGAVDEVWAQIVAMDGRERYYASAISPTVTTKVKAWYDERYVPDKARLVLREHIYLIKGVVDIEGKHIVVRMECEQQKVAVP